MVDSVTEAYCLLDKTRATSFRYYLESNPAIMNEYTSLGSVRERRRWICTYMLGDKSLAAVTPPKDRRFQTHDIDFIRRLESIDAYILATSSFTHSAVKRPPSAVECGW